MGADRHEFERRSARQWRGRASEAKYATIERASTSIVASGRDAAIPPPEDDWAAGLVPAGTWIPKTF
jgi:hypothetical protein